jgi:hypothetical protein
MNEPSVDNRRENFSYRQSLSLVSLAQFFILAFLYKVMIIYVGFKVLTSVTMKSTVFWVKCCVAWREPNILEENIVSIFRVNPEDGGDTFLRNVRLSLNYMELQPVHLEDDLNYHTR